LRLPSQETVLAMIRACTDRHANLVSGGCADDVALDRTWDAYVCALTQSSTHCFDPRDRLFENKLRTIVQKGNDNAPQV